MNCRYCGSELKPGAVHCPHCGFDVTAQDLESVLKEIVRLEGQEKLLDGQSLLNLLADVAPELKKERNLLSLLVSLQGNEMILESSRIGETALQKAVQNTARQLSEDYSVDPARAKEICEIFAAAVAPDKNPEGKVKDDSAPTEKVCPHCGAVNLANSIYCSQCSRKLEEENKVAPTSNPNLSAEKKLSIWFALSAAVLIIENPIAIVLRIIAIIILILTVFLPIPLKWKLVTAAAVLSAALLIVVPGEYSYFSLFILAGALSFVLIPCGIVGTKHSLAVKSPSLAAVSATASMSAQTAEPLSLVYMQNREKKASYIALVASAVVVTIGSGFIIWIFYSLIVGLIYSLMMGIVLLITVLLHIPFKRKLVIIAVASQCCFILYVALVLHYSFISEVLPFWRHGINVIISVLSVDLLPFSILGIKQLMK